jgi:hypothetical protein
VATRAHVQVVITLAVVVWAAMLVVEGVTVKASYLQPYSLTVGVVVVVLFGFDRWLWRVPLVARALHCPVLQGTWRGQLRSSWVDPTTGLSVGPVDVFLAITQTYSRISLRLMTPESASRSLVASLDAPRDDIARVTLTYQNLPGLMIQDRSRIHHGVLMLNVEGSPASRLVGSYWTDRDTKGEVRFEGKSTKVYTSFREALEQIPAPGVQP